MEFGICNKYSFCCLRIGDWFRWARYKFSYLSNRRRTPSPIIDNPEHAKKVLDTLQEALSHDRTKTSLIGMTPLGLVELTRKKTRSMSADIAHTQLPCYLLGGNTVGLEYRLF